MKILIASDSYKECLPAREVATAMAAGVLETYPSAEIACLPLADGGEGTLEVLSEALHAKVQTVEVHDPLGRKIEAKFGVSGDIGIIEVAQACGFSRLSPPERNPIVATSMGVGELIMTAHKAGCLQLFVSLGGSATCDGGAGMLSVSGIKGVFREMSIELLCDVENPFTGPEGAARVFAPQKGASASDVESLEVRMRSLAEQYLAETGIDVSATPGAGAAGGIAGALIAYGGAKVVSGIDRVLELVGFDEAARDADLIITGEGRSDLQTLKGKVPMGVLRHCPATRVALVSGAIAPDAAPALSEAGFWKAVPATPPGMKLSQAMNPDTAKRNIMNAAVNCANLIG